MKALLTRTMVALAVGAVIVGSASAEVKKAHHMGASVMKCPVCHMTLGMKKTKANPVAVRLKKGGKIMYCCAGCKMPASVLVKSHKHKAKVLATKN